jgi:integrase
VTKRGFGGIYKRGSIYWIRYWHRGTEYRESSDSDSEAQARKLLKQRIQEMGRPGRFIGPSQDRVTFTDLAEMVRTDYAINRFRSAEHLTCRLAHLSNYFANARAIDITSDRIQAYVAERQQSGASNATINRELAVLKRAFALALRAERLSHAPHIALLAENNARTGFVEHAEFVAIREQLPDHLKDPIAFLYLTGWRVSEMMSLEWRDIDHGAQTIRLRPENSKNSQSREIPFALFPELGEIITRARDNRRLECRAVFHRDGLPIRDFRTSWSNACTQAGLGNVLVHDLRRTAVRNLVRAGVPEAIAMQVTGHKSRTVFERYNIVSPSDKQNALQKLATYLDAQSTTPTIVPLTNSAEAIS